MPNSIPSQHSLVIKMANIGPFWGPYRNNYCWPSQPSPQSQPRYSWPSMFSILQTCFYGELNCICCGNVFMKAARRHLVTLIPNQSGSATHRKTKMLYLQNHRKTSAYIANSSNYRWQVILIEYSSANGCQRQTQPTRRSRYLSVLNYLKDATRGWVATSLIWMRHYTSDCHWQIWTIRTNYSHPAYATYAIDVRQYG